MDRSRQPYAIPGVGMVRGRRWPSGFSHHLCCNGWLLLLFALLRAVFLKNHLLS